MKIIKNIWKIICYPLMYLGVQVVVFFIYIFAITIGISVKLGIESAMSGEPIQIDNAEGLIASQVNFMIPVVISVFITVLVIFFILRKEWIADKFWSFGRFKIAPVLLCLSLGAALNILTICVFAMVPIPPQPQPFDDLIGSSLIVDLLIISILTPILEEIIFRGIVLKRLNKMTTRHVAVFLQAVIFGVIHLNIMQGIYAFVLGVIIGYIYLWFDSIYVAIAIHVAYNGTSIVLLYIFGDSDVDLFYFLLISAAVFIVSMATLAALADRKEKEDSRIIY